ncbi:MAG: hypothetical protein DMG65_15355 [Candidatus Angelobacter sp. Gp1-AA117]|nr:MAG: hypothetical protein DMG65_15355 [Candidatus Angelobacter sp. Gp1-AA117]
MLNRNISSKFGVLSPVRTRNGRRNGLLLILLALLVYAGWLRWADQLQRILTFDLSTVVITAKFASAENFLYSVY